VVIWLRYQAGNQVSKCGNHSW